MHIEPSGPACRLNQVLNELEFARKLKKEGQVFILSIEIDLPLHLARKERLKVLVELKRLLFVILIMVVKLDK